MPLAKLWKKLANRKGSQKPRVKKVKAKPVRKKAKNKVKPLKKKSLPEKILSGKPQEKEVGVVTHYFGNIQVGIIKVKTGFKLGDKIHIKGLHDDFTQSIDSMQYEHKSIATAKRGLEVGIKVIKPVHENDKVYKQSA